MMLTLRGGCSMVSTETTTSDTEHICTCMCVKRVFLVTTKTRQYELLIRNVKEIKHDIVVNAGQ